MLHTSASYSLELNAVSELNDGKNAVYSNINNGSESNLSVLLSNGVRFELKGGSGKAILCSDIQAATMYISLSTKENYVLSQAMACGYSYNLTDATK